MTDDTRGLEHLNRLLAEAHRLRDSSKYLKRIMAEQARKIDERRADSLLEELQNRPALIIH